MGQRGRPRKHYPPLPDKERVAHHRQQLKEQGHRNISFMVNPEEYKVIEKARAKLGLTSKELLMYYLLRQNIYDEKSDVYIEQIQIEEERKYSYLDIDLRRGYLFDFPNKKDFLIVSYALNQADFPSWFPYKPRYIRGFHTAEEAFQYYLRKRDKLPKSEQIVLMARAHEYEQRPEGPPSLYVIAVRFNRLFHRFCNYGDGTTIFYEKLYQEACQRFEADE